LAVAQRLVLILSHISTTSSQKDAEAEAKFRKEIYRWKTFFSVDYFKLVAWRWCII